MTLETLTPDENTQLDDLELKLHKRTRMTKWVIAIILLVSIGISGWLLSGLAGYSPPEPTPLERLLTTRFADLQLDWFETLSTGSRVNKRLLVDKQEKFMTSAEKFLAEIKEYHPDLHTPMTKLLETMRRYDQISLLAETPAKALGEPVAETNKVLEGLTPRFMLDVEHFEGLINDSYVVAGMIRVFEILNILHFSAGERTDTIDLYVVRVRDTLPSQAFRHGYTRRDDADLAFVLQDNATSHASDYLFPSFARADAAFERRFKDRVPDEMKKPYRVLLELVQLELRDLAETSKETFDEVAGNVAKRAQIFKRAEEMAEKLGISLKRPDGLLWPPTFAAHVLLENTEANKKGEKILYDSDKDALMEVTRALDNDEAQHILEAVANGIVRAVGFHEARHVLDVRDAREAGFCIRDKVRIVDRDPDFLRSVDLECRAYLTEIIEAPETVRMTLLGLLNHLYSRSGTTNFYAARTLLHPLVFEKDEENIPYGWNYIEELTLRLAAAEPEQLKAKALSFYAECFDDYVPLTLTADERIRQDSGGCSTTGF
jgi:hypothetical protein